MTNHQALIQGEFAKQAKNFNDPRHSVGSNNIVEWIVKPIDPSPTDEILDVACGTAILGRALARLSKFIAAVDATPAMLEEAEHTARQEGLKNIDFLLASAENLPFRSERFDLVVSRLALHHFTQPETAVGEMLRVCKKNGKIYIIDLVAPDDTDLQRRYNEFERMRDPSHVRAHTSQQIMDLFRAFGKSAKLRDFKSIEVDFDRWVFLSQTPESNVSKIRGTLLGEIENQQTRSGFQPYLLNGSLKFLQKWVIVEAQV